MTDIEEAMMPEYLEHVRQTSGQRAPNLPVNPRAMAEWEELQGIVIAWTDFFRDIQIEIVRSARLEVTVYIVTDNQADVESRLSQAGVDFSSNVEFINSDYNTVWIRDYGPNTIYLDDVDSLVIVDWIYNRPRYADDQVPQAVGDHLGLEVLELASQPDDLVHTGGNFMSNGNGQGFSSELVLDENGPNNSWGMSNHSEADVDEIMREFMGINEYIKMVNLPFDLIHHIDMHMKMLDEETIIVGEYPQGVADGPQIEANIQYILENFRTTFDREWNIIRIPMPPDYRNLYPDRNGEYRTYANAMFVNKTVLVPIYEEQYDTTALNIWQNALPGHEIVGIDCNKIISYSGALHCIIKEIGISDPIWVLHESLRSPDMQIQDDWEIDAIIKHREGIQNAKVFYSTDEGVTYDSLDMTADDSLWTVTLPILADDFIYYIKAEATNGRILEKPQTGSLGGGYRVSPKAISSTRPINSDINVGQVFPNPANAMTAVPIQVNRTHELNVQLLNMQGQFIDQIYNESYHPNQRHVFFDAGKYSPGSYLLNINDETGHVNRKIIIGF